LAYTCPQVILLLSFRPIRSNKDNPVPSSRYKNAMKKKHYNQALKIACETGELDKVRNLLTNEHYKDKVDVNNISNANGETALDVVHRAILDETIKAEIIQELKKHNAMTAQQVKAQLATMQTTLTTSPSTTPVTLLSAPPASSSLLILEKLHTTTSAEVSIYPWKNDIQLGSEKNKPTTKADFAVGYKSTSPHPVYLYITIGNKGFISFEKLYISFYFATGIRTQAWQQALMRNMYMAQKLEYIENKVTHTANSLLTVFVGSPASCKSIMEVINKINQTDFPDKLLDEALTTIATNKKPYTPIEMADVEDPEVSDLIKMQNTIFGPRAILSRNPELSTTSSHATQRNQSRPTR
jgi:hypothetical protein